MPQATVTQPHDFELDSTLLGPSTRMLAIEADPSGGLFYQFGRREPRALQLPEAYAGRWFAVIDMSQIAIVLEPGTMRLVALVAFTGQGNMTVLFGREWGRWFDGEGNARRTENMPGLLRRMKAAVGIDEARRLLTIDFQMNPYNPDGYTREVMNMLHEGPLRHVLALRFGWPEGAFHSSMIEVREGSGERLKMVFDVNEFPLTMPRPASPKRRQVSAAPLVTPLLIDNEDPLEAALRRKRQAGGGVAPNTNERKTATPPPPPQGEKPRPVRPAEAFRPVLIQQKSAGPPTAGAGAAAERKAEASVTRQSTQLGTQELLTILEVEKEAELRWKIIEANLMLGRPERSYPLIVRYGEMIAERTCDWPAARLRLAFAHQPGSVLTNIMTCWSNNAVLAVADANAEQARILAWLGEREVERMLGIKTEKDPASAEQARALLGVDKQADAAMVKRVWRTLLGMMNADHGRSQERAIHRRKDEIAKHLQVARNILMK